MSQDDLVRTHEITKSYLTRRGNNLKRVLLLLDARHGLKLGDEQFFRELFATTESSLNGERREVRLLFFSLFFFYFFHLTDASEIFISFFAISIFFEIYLRDERAFNFFHLCHCNNYFFPFTLLSQQYFSFYFSFLFLLLFAEYFFVSSIILFFFIAILIFMFSSLCVHSLSSISLFLPLFFVF